MRVHTEYAQHHMILMNIKQSLPRMTLNSVQYQTLFILFRAWSLMFPLKRKFRATINPRCCISEKRVKSAGGPIWRKTNSTNELKSSKPTLFSCARHKCLKFQTSHAFYVPTPQNSQTKFCCKSTNTENFKGCTKTILGRKKDCSTLSTKHKQEKTNFYTMSQIISIFSIISWQSWFLATSSAVQCHNITLLHIWYIKNPAPKNLIQWSHLQKTLPQRTTISFGNLGLCKLDIL